MTDLPRGSGAGRHEYRDASTEKAQELTAEWEHTEHSRLYSIEAIDISMDKKIEDAGNLGPGRLAPGTPSYASSDSTIPPPSDSVNISENCSSELRDPVTEAVRHLFGLSYLFPYQRLVVANILEAAEGAAIPIHWPAECDTEAVSAEADDDGADVEATDRESLGRQIVILPTGAGKSLCFQLPAMLLEGATLVIYPILSLMADQERRLQERGFAPVVLRGGQTQEERDAIWKKLRSGESRFIIANPEVLLTPRVVEKLGQLGIVHVVVDEAHCVSEWGERFRPSYLELSTIIEATNAPLVTAFTATASASVLEKIERYLFCGNGVHRITGNPDRNNISYAAQGCILRDLAVRDLLIANQRPAIVFCSSRPGTEKLARYLRNELEDQEIRFYHAGLGREEKTVVEKWFLHNERGILIATCAFGLGIDKADIRTVIHRDCPPSVEAYLQESGRAGRDGLQSRAILLWGPDDEGRLRRAKTDADRQRLTKLLDYGRDGAHCRRQALLRLLDYEGTGEHPESECCDVCAGRATAALREEASLLGFFRRNPRAFTTGEAVHILANAESINWSGEDARLAINQLIRMGKLRKSRNYLWKNKLALSRTYQ
ncbi:ATP-dependent DNA helicase RecQ [Spirochaetia bacterium]|nr:ATP-dependent DNA helicase RecQ [Spirochaetia bacterium]